MKYVIKTPYKTLEYKRIDSALRNLLLEAYNSLAADGQLDTRAGHNFYNDLKKYVNTQSFKDNNLIAQLPNGQFITFNEVGSK